MALLAAAARCLTDGECYLEAGTFNGLSAITAGLSSKADLWLIDDFSMTTRDALDRNLARYGLLSRTHVVCDDAVNAIGQLPLLKVGLFYYDAAHDSASTLLSLRGVRRLLTAPALVMVDDFDFPAVRAAVEIFLRENSSASLLYGIPGKDKGADGWWYGSAVILWSPQ